MKLRSFLKSITKAEREDFAKRIGTTPAYLEQLRYGFSKPGAKLCSRIEEASGGKVTREELRPDIFGALS